MSSNGLARWMIGIFGVLLIAFTVISFPNVAWSLVPIAFIILALLFALPGRALTSGPKSPKTQRILYAAVFVVVAILAMLLPEVVGGEGISGSILAVTAIAAAVIGAISWYTYRLQGGTRASLRPPRTFPWNDGALFGWSVNSGVNGQRDFPVGGQVISPSADS